MTLSSKHQLSNQFIHVLHFEFMLIALLIGYLVRTGKIAAVKNLSEMVISSARIRGL